MTNEEKAKIDENMREVVKKIHATYKDNPLTVKVDPKDIQRVFKGMIFQVVAWDNLNKDNPTIQLQLAEYT